METLKDYIKDVYTKENMANIYNDGDSAIGKNQDVYDAFNTFMFSPDRNIFNKLAARIALYSKIHPLHGDIIECGVYKGSGLLTWLKILDVTERHSIRKVVGFDMFDPTRTLELITDNTDHDMMKQVFDRDTNKEDVSYTSVRTRIERAGFGSDKFELVQGNICRTAFEYVSSKPGLRISLLYLDLDIAEPTEAALSAFHERIVPGGMIVFDEYAYQNWSETDAADDFIHEYGDEYEIERTSIKAPTLILTKK